MTFHSMNARYLFLAGYNMLLSCYNGS